ncbi:MAG: NAD-dependent epimerase/dehydratase family protein [Rhodospirillaceae bacterium]|nr:NAD-dependent epimerase/dehydratase family protein [Rhodospirillales bacterium]
MRILVTGASGFVGGPVCRRLLSSGHEVIAAVRRDDAFLPMDVEARRVAELGPNTDWRGALKGCDGVIHLAARAHVMRDTATDRLTLFRRINRDGTVRLAEQAAGAGVGRFVFVSSIKVNGEATPAHKPFHGDDAPAPLDPYGISKAEAEAELAGIATRTGLSLAVVRPPMVHGPGAKGNLAALMRVLDKGLPLPLGAIRNRRSLVGVENLADALAFLVTHPAQGRFLIRDGEDISTPELIRNLAEGLGRKACLPPVPVALLRLAASLLGKGAAMQRLTGSLVVDDSPLRALDWVPPVTLADGLRAVAAAHASSNREVRCG